jgi:reductive dehalogenase
MKALGLGAAGIGATAAAAPVFHDLDELVASPQAEWKRPWYVKEVDQPTTEVDWNLKKPWSEVNTLRGSRRYMDTYIDQEEQESRSLLKSEKHADWLAKNRPGYSQKDVALSSGTGAARVSNTFMPTRTLNTTKWSGSPEEATAMVRAAGRLFGHMTVSAMEIDDSTTKKLLYSYEPGGKEKLTWKDNGPFEIKNEEHAHTSDARWVISVVNMESQELWKRNPALIQSQIRYGLESISQLRFQTFLARLGYWALSEGGNGTGVAPAIATMAGQGEIGRINRIITPEYGPTVGVFRYVTNLPLAPGKPIDAGLNRFCYTCKKCAEACGEGALSLETEPTWDPSENSTPYNEAAWSGHDLAEVPGALPPTPGGWHNPGHKTWFEDSRKCRAWKLLPEACNAGRCHAVCTFTKYDISSVHEIVAGTVATTSIFNGFFKTMDDAFGYGLRGRHHDDFLLDNADADKDIDSWWSLMVPQYGIDTTIGGHKGIS